MMQPQNALTNKARLNIEKHIDKVGPEKDPDMPKVGNVRPWRLLNGLQLSGQQK
jgi:hypothetical protein